MSDALGINELLRARREEILRLAASHGARNIRVFGSVARGEADQASDVDFLVETDELIQSWIVRHLQIIGEAARALPEAVREQAPAVPWSRIIGMRHILVHDYRGIDTGIVSSRSI